MKIYRRIRTWILVGLVLIVEGLAFWIYNESGGQPYDHTLWGGVLFMSNLTIAALFATIIIAADSVAGEFSGGTIKLLLIRPATRTKILLSKYLSVFGFLLFLFVILFVTSFIVSGLMYGFGSTTELYSYMGKGNVTHHISLASQTFRSYGFSCILIVIIISLCFMVSSVFRSSAIAITISIVLFFAGAIIGGIISQFKWAKYYLFSNVDLQIYLTDQIPIPGSGMTLTFSIIVLLVYFIIFNGLSWFVFKKRDVAS
ncbi:ABC transporter permease [Paenibacillus psychroresistens]|uniref:ABC transporter permease n=2 Tax=Paenibacillus psychroresistens TaxID=1778678 RepID=A0A6B8RRM5_9BACL|nr:ABC transporter permease [Paenibacillus psychroresistens]QGQ98517.1 ABC transporter permease [Paenibacillus psychroresistens]